LKFISLAQENLLNKEGVVEAMAGLEELEMIY
jgi:hypothetical protein